MTVHAVQADGLESLHRTWRYREDLGRDHAGLMHANRHDGIEMQNARGPRHT